MSKMFQAYGLGQALLPVLPPPLPFQTAPTSNQTNYEIGQMVYTPVHNPTAFYLYGGGGNWVEIATNSGDVLSVTGTANQILASPTTGAVVLSLIGPYTPATYTAHGVLIGEGTSSIVATAAGTTGQVLTATTSADPAFAAIGTNSGLTAHGVVIAENTGAFAATAAGTAGQALVSGGASADPVWTTATFPSTATAGALIAATATNVIGQIADVAVGQVLASGGVGVIPAYTGSPSLSGSLTVGTGLTVTTGNATLSGSGNGVVYTPVIVGAAGTPQTANGRVFSVTFSGVSIAAGATQSFVINNTAVNTLVQLSMVGATSGSALSIQSITNSAGVSTTIVVTNGTGATTSTANLTFTGFCVN
jgi:hypothetical protein